MAGTAPPPPPSPCPAANRAALALGEHYGLNDAASHALSLWINTRILSLNSYVEEDRWQWDVSLVAWIIQHSGALQATGWNYAQLTELYTKAGVTASLTRSQPFKDWQSKKIDDYGAHTHRLAA